MSNGRRWKKNLMFRLGANVHGDLRWAKSREADSVSSGGEGKVSLKKRPRWQGSVEFAGLTKQKRVRNRWLSQSLMSSVGSLGTDVRVRDSFGTSMLQRKKLGMMYGFGVKFPHRMTEDLVKRASKGVRYRTSLLSQFELQLNVVRWRSGLVKSVGMADDRIVSGRVAVHYPDAGSVRETYPMIALYPGVVVQIDPDVWATVSEEMFAYWSVKGNERMIPPYLQVSFESGTVTILWVPRDSDVVMPVNMTFSVKSFYTG